MKKTTSLLILVMGNCRTRQAASCAVSTPFRNAFPTCLTEALISMFPCLTSQQALSIIVLIPFCVFVT